MAKNIPERRLKEQQHEPYYTQEWNVPAPLMESGMSFNGQPFPSGPNKIRTNSTFTPVKVIE